MKSSTKASLLAIALLGLSVSCKSTEETPADPVPTDPVPEVAPEYTPEPVAAPESTPETAAVAATFPIVYFEYDSSTLSQAAQTELGAIADQLLQGGSVNIQIEGHCDERGSNEYNMALGHRRAEAVKRFFTGRGVSASQVSTISYGEERPAIQGSSEDAWSQNRRAEFQKLN